MFASGGLLHTQQSNTEVCQSGDASVNEAGRECSNCSKVGSDSAV